MEGPLYFYNQENWAGVMKYEYPKNNKRLKQATVILRQY
jgi:hypothetical protein